MAVMRIAIPEIGSDVTNYTNAILGTGGQPVVVSVGEMTEAEKKQPEYIDYKDFKVDDFDGLLLPGGGDIAPERFGQKNEGSRDIVPELDELQFDVLEAFVKAGKPVLGICRGHQVINVYFGGTLIQDLPDACEHARDAGSDQDKVHQIVITNGSWMAHQYPVESFTNSSHHQALGQMGEGMIIDARCPFDGVIEAAHHQKLPVWSVQFHPERMSFFLQRDDTVDGSKIFEFFIHECEKRAADN